MSVKTLTRLPKPLTMSVKALTQFAKGFTMPLKALTQFAKSLTMPVKPLTHLVKGFALFVKALTHIFITPSPLAKLVPLADLTRLLLVHPQAHSHLVKPAGVRYLDKYNRLWLVTGLGIG